MKVEKISVSWGIKWPGPADYSMLSPSVTLNCEVAEDEDVERAIDDAHTLALQSVIECLQDGLIKVTEVYREKGSRV